MTNKEFSELIEQFNELDKEAKNKAAQAKTLSEQIKAEFQRRNAISFTTEHNLEGSIVTSTTMTFDEVKLVNWLKSNNKAYLVKEVPILDAVKSEIKNKIITESAMEGIKSETVSKKLYVRESKD